MSDSTPLLGGAALTLASAMLASSSVPLILLDGELTVIGASASFCQAFEIDPAAIVGGSIFALGSGEWNVRQLRALLELTVSGAGEVDAYEMDLKRPGQDARRLVLNAHKLDYDDLNNARLLLTVSDVTDARADAKLKDDLLREKAILLQEVQHRVANSLQIIASVILQNARRVQSKETRSHLTDAHQRVMSVALLQQQLAATRLGDVGLRAYFEDLCRSVAASMIRDHDQVSIVVKADDSAVSPDVSVSLGLIITELVINSLKHAFPGSRHGVVVVGYEAHGPNWTLTVGDNGVGMPTNPLAAKPGLGTSIVEALANQLQARVQITEARPGTLVSIVHSQIAAVESDATARAKPAI